MKILVLNGSPKADNSITLQHIHFLKKRKSTLDLEIVHISKSISRYEKNQELFDGVVQKMRAAHAIVWSFPVYYALVPSQMKRFIELLFERYPNQYFKGVYATSLTTSINFFDHTAHNYVQGVCEDLGFSYAKSYSAHMDDFFHKDMRRRMESFFEWFIQVVNKKVPQPLKYGLTLPEAIVYKPDTSHAAENKDGSKKILLLTDDTDPDTNLSKMIQAFVHESPRGVAVKNIKDSGMKHGCLGCCTCGFDNTCKQKDGFAQFYNDNLKKADIIIIAGTIKDHYLSSTWKQFFDRSFFNGHAPVLQGKRLGFIISGPLSQIQNLRETLDALADNWHMKSSGVVTDEFASSDEISAQIKGFAQNLDIACKTDLHFAASFYSVGGGKIFRDFVFNTSAVFMADHKFYKKQHVYGSFPQRKLKKRFYNALFYLFVSIKPLRRQIHRKFIPGMVAPYKKLLKKL